MLHYSLLAGLAHDETRAYTSGLIPRPLSSKRLSIQSNDSVKHTERVALVDEKRLTQKISITVSEPEDDGEDVVSRASFIPLFILCF